jgi:predicted transcriptional regulator
MTPLDRYGRVILGLLAKQPDMSGVAISEATGIHKSVVSVALRRAADRGLIRRSLGCKRSIRVTERGHDWMAEDAAPVDFDTTRRRNRILQHLLHESAWVAHLQTELNIPHEAVGAIVRAMLADGLIYKAYDGYAVTAGGRDWLRARGVEVDKPRGKVRTCLMCDNPSKPGRWFCRTHVERRSQMFRDNDDGSYCPSSGGMTL